MHLMCTVLNIFKYLLLQAVKKHYLTKRWMLRIISERVSICCILGHGFVWIQF